jgi:deoxyadenosine/deoxycytidine kinase
MGLDIKKAKRNKKMLHTFESMFDESIWETTKSKKNNKLIQVECQPSKTSTYIDI